MSLSYVIFFSSCEITRKARAAASARPVIVVIEPPVEPINGLGSNNVVSKDIRYRGVRKRPWGKYVAKIKNPWKKTRVWLSTFDSVEAAARAYNTAARTLRGPKAKTNFPLSYSHSPPFVYQNPNNPFVAPQLYGSGGLQEPQVNPHRPTLSSLSSTVESFSGPRPTITVIIVMLAVLSKRRSQRVGPPGDCQIDCDSSSSMIDDDGGDIASSSCRKPTLPFDLNFPPLDVVDYAVDGYDLNYTALCF